MTATPRKVFDERVKLIATTLNNVGLGFGGFAFIRPLTTGDIVVWGYVGVALVLFCSAHYVLGYVRPEDAP